MILSKRLQAIADLVDRDEVVADIGTDHGYVPIYLVQEKICSKVYACDINKGPYNKAKQHIASYGLTSSIETRLSDGMKALEVGEATTVLIAGMGGGLVVKILEQDKRLWDSIRYFILQPQSELEKVRQYLQKNQWKIINEKMVMEDGKYYPMMKVERGEVRPYSQMELAFGPQLLKEKNPVLLEFVHREIQLKESVVDSLKQKNAVHIEQRVQEIQEELEVCYEVCRYYE